MKLHRVFAIILRYLFLIRRSFDILTDAFYWPTIDLLLWGLTSSYLSAYVPNSHLVLAIISGILFWIVMWRGQYEITVGLLHELWDRNMINIFVSPITFSEWILALISMGVIKALMSFAFASFVAFLLYKVGIFTFGFYIIPFIVCLVMNGWWVGFLVASLILRFGTRIQTLAWTTVALLSPFSAIYYPLSILPQWAQNVARFVPASYIFEGTREVINTGKLDWNKVFISFGLNIVYLAISIVLLRWSFRKVFDRGLTSLQ